MILRNNLFGIYIAVLVLEKIKAGSLEVLTLDGPKYDKLERKRVLCGKNLTKILQLFCVVYNSPHTTEHRMKRQIVDECCHRPCSINHILDFYCEAFNSEALEHFLNQPDEDKTQGDQAWDVPQQSTSPVKKDSPRVPHEKNNNGVKQTIHQHDSTNSEALSRNANTNPRRKPRDKRNCACKKRSHKKSKRTNKSTTTSAERILSNIKPVPEPKIGEIENSQNPFYVLNRYKR